MQFEAAVLHEIGRPVVIEQVEITQVKRSDVLIKMAASGLCHTDLEIIQGSLKAPLPIVLGHEGAGVVEEVGAEVTKVKPGDHVVLSWNPNCGECFYCVRDLPIVCEVYARNSARGNLMDGSSRLSLKGRTLHHQSFVSSHAEYCIVPESAAISIPKEMPLDRACLLGCGVMTGVGGVLRVAKVAPGSSVAVLGCGVVGLNAVQGAVLAQSEKIIAVDVSERKLEAAWNFGATHTINAILEDPVACIRDLTSGRGADCTLEAAGNETTLQQSLEAARPGGRVVILGKVNFDSYVPLRFGSLVGEKQITRSSYGGARPDRDFPFLAQRYFEGRLKLDELITRRLRLLDINSGYEDMGNGQSLRAVITFSEV